jgi:hypothetical protein
MTPLLLGAAWLLFVISCFASMVPSGNAKPVVRPAVKSKTGGKDEETT